MLLPNLLSANTITGLFIGKSPSGAIGYIHIKMLPMNQLYTVLHIQNHHCGGQIKGYTKRQDNRFILYTDVPDPRKDDAHQCQVTFIQKEEKLLVTKEENCNEWHGIDCSFISINFFSNLAF